MGTNSFLWTREDKDRALFRLAVDYYLFFFLIHALNTRLNVLYWHFKPIVSPPLSSYLQLCKEFILGVCDQEVIQQAFSLFLPKTFIKIETVLVSSTDRLVAFRTRVSLF